MHHLTPTVLALWTGNIRALVINMEIITCLSDHIFPQLPHQEICICRVLADWEYFFSSEFSD
jgi:hypothetical protein